MDEIKSEKVTPEGNKRASMVEMVTPIIAKFKIGHAFNKAVTTSPQGCHSLALLIETMAMQIDRLKSVEVMSDEEFKDYTERENRRRGLDNL